jgi:hypothetical protein
VENSFIDSILKICNSLNNHNVQYLIVDGTAVALHGYFRMSTNQAGQEIEKPDFDFWYNPTYENYFRLLSALSDLGQDVTQFQKDKSPNPRRSFFKFERELFTLDFLPEIKGLDKFNNASKNKVVTKIKDVEMPFISYNDLILSKQINRRPKDLIDIIELEKLKAGANKNNEA